MILTIDLALYISKGARSKFHPLFKHLCRKCSILNVCHESNPTYELYQTRLFQDFKIILKAFY